MKFKFWIAPLAAMMFTLFSSTANAVIIDFIDEIEKPGGIGESAWTVLSLPVFGLQITGGASDDDDQQQYAYLDWGRAGLGVCKDAFDVNSSVSGSTANHCSPSSDDNVTNNEFLDFVFDQDVEVDFWFNNNHDGGFDMGDQVTIAGMAYAVSEGYAGGANGIGSFFVAAGNALRVEFNNEQFYVSGMKVSAVPVPAAVWLFGTALAGLLGFGRRRRAAA